MDSVRFGRALGIGARLAAKTLVTAVDAAAAPNPSAPPARTSPPSPQPYTPPPAPPLAQSQTAPQTAPGRTEESAARRTIPLRKATRGIAQGSRRFGEAAWGPVVKLSGVLWLEFTGVFFGIFALFAAAGAWKLRGNLHRTTVNDSSITHFELALAMAIIFGYFCISSFVRASRRSRRH